MVPMTAITTFVNDIFADLLTYVGLLTKMGFCDIYVGCV